MSSSTITESSVALRRPTPEQIAARAYALYQERGCQPGHEVDDWLQAEYELMQLPIRKLAEMRPTRTARKPSLIALVRAAMY